ncbi:MAG: hypothetical protein WCA78_04400 [Rhizomicrobium sp.]
MNIGEVAIKVILMLLVFVLEVLIGRRVVQGLLTGVLQVRTRGCGAQLFARRRQPFGYWFWMYCHVGAMVFGGPLVVLDVLRW